MPKMGHPNGGGTDEPAAPLGRDAVLQVAGEEFNDAGQRACSLRRPDRESSLPFGDK
jgi:hypothetical protein